MFNVLIAVMFGTAALLVGARPAFSPRDAMVLGTYHRKLFLKGCDFILGMIDNLVSRTDAIIPDFRTDASLLILSVKRGSEVEAIEKNAALDRIDATFLIENK